MDSRIENCETLAPLGELDFMAFVAERDLELFLEFLAKRAMESPPSEQDCQEPEESLAAQYVLDFDTSLLK
jgi:hypothetical protein